MKLLIKRDPLVMLATTGRPEVESDVPKSLSRAAYIADLGLRDRLLVRDHDDLVILSEQDAPEVTEALRTYKDNFLAMPALWSGYRSVIMGDGNGGMYRIKGCSLNPFRPEIRKYENGEHDVFGGQPRFSAEFEKMMSDKFNRVLREEGLAPVMECKGYWHYPTRVKGDKYSASVVKVQGDTRLDEFMFLLEAFLRHRVHNGESSPMLNVNGGKLFRNMGNLYSDMGFYVGYLKRLMDRNNQTWSADNARSNAHIGNVVIYREQDLVKVGLVDFDASCDTDDFSLSQLQDMQRREHETMVRSAQGLPISPRQINGKFFDYDGPHPPAVYNQLRDKLVEGFEMGYSIGASRTQLWDGIEFGRFQEIFEMLRSGVNLLDIPRAGFGGLRDIFREEERRYREKEETNIDNIYGILGRNRAYQDDLLGLKYGQEKRGYGEDNRKDLISYMNDKDEDDYYGLGKKFIKKEKKDLIYRI